MSQADPVFVVPCGDVATASVLWRVEGQLYVTVIAKLSLRLSNGGPMELLSAGGVLRRDSYRGDDPARSLRLANDCAPYLANCDVVLAGHGYPSSEGATSTQVRLAVRSGNTWLLDKMLNVYGDRDAPGSAPGSFRRVPLDYEHAYGGEGFPANPVGVGLNGGVANVVGEGAAPGGFGPISPRWAPRANALPPRHDDGLIDIPTPFDWGYFQAAPEDQRVPPLRGDEWLVLQGLTRATPRFETRLPGYRGVARVWAHGGSPIDDGQPVGMLADSLAVQGDALMATLVWRGHFPVESVEALSGLCVAAGIEAPATPVDWDEIDGRVATRKLTAAVQLSASNSITLVRESKGTTPAFHDAEVDRLLGRKPSVEAMTVNASDAAAALDDTDLVGDECNLVRHVIAPPTAAGAGLQTTAAVELDQTAEATPWAPQVAPDHSGPTRAIPGAPWETGSMEEVPPDLDQRRHSSTAPMSGARLPIVHLTPLSIVANPHHLRPPVVNLVVVCKASCDLAADGSVHVRATPDPLTDDQLAPDKRLLEVSVSGYPQPGHFTFSAGIDRAVDRQAGHVVDAVGELVGGETFSLSGMHPSATQLSGRLPGVRARVFAEFHPEHALSEVALRLDTVHFDLTRFRVQLVWRGAVPVQAPDASDVLSLFAVLERAGEPPIGPGQAREQQRAARLAMQMAADAR